MPEQISIPVKLPCLKKPCKDCPFRKDSMKGWLGKHRIIEILQQDSFVCHKNTNLQCAGHMLMVGKDNIFLRTARNMGIDLHIAGRDLVFKTIKACIRHHS